MKDSSSVNGEQVTKMAGDGTLKFQIQRRITPIVALIVIGLILAGSAVSVSAQTPELVMWVRDDYGWNLEQIITTFARDYGVKVRIETMPLAAIREQFPAEADGENAPDIITDSDELVRGYLDQHLLEPVNLGNKAADYIPFAIQVFTHEGSLYAVPYALENLAFVRNTEMVPELPRTWDEVQEVARAVQDTGAADYGFVLPAGDGFFYHFYPILDAYGGYLFGTTPDGTLDGHDIGLDNDGAIAAATWLQRMVQDGLAPAEMNWEEAHAAFETGRAAMIITGPWGIWRFVDAGIPFAVSAFPAGVHPSRPFVHVQGFLINAHSDKKALAQEFLAGYIATEASMRVIAENTGRISAHMAVYETVDDPVLRGFEEVLQYGQRYPDLPQAGLAQDMMSEALRQIVAGDQPPQAALFGAAAAIRQEIGG
jgi:arabinogalactan oligomer/maltooligosaccharide transport system substrate-binding protein